ncbi:MAG: TatD family hydrolase [Firmicutes bacterium]|mgnify:CR=1 FL=1|nr:TatD family hydrolase [Bacillota bacterium]
MIDSHAHLNDPAFADDLDEVVARAEAAGVKTIINVGYDLTSSRRAIALSERYPTLWAVVGLHPHDAKFWTEELWDTIIELASHPKVLAIGEAGLDYHYDNSPRDVQRAVFREQLALGRQLNMPVVIHSREAAKDTLEILGEYPDVPCLLHCYSGSLESARSYQQMGHYFSFGGPITFNNAHKLRDVVAGIPLERILLETDCPYLTPHPYRGKRNEPAHLPLVAQKLAEVHGCTLEDVVRQTEENTRAFFRLMDKEDS